MTGHARLSPSSASRWTACPGSLRLIGDREIQDSSSRAAEEGTAAHELLEMCILQGKYPNEFLGIKLNPCEFEPDGFLVDKEMVEHITDVYAWLVDKVAGSKGVLFPERRVNPGAMFGRDDCSGTADITIIHPPFITMGDLKYGAGIGVEVENNLQLLLYGMGVLAEMSVEERKQIKWVDMFIMQPRYNHSDGTIRSIRYSVADLYMWAEWFRLKAMATDDPNAPLSPGDSQCRFCPVKSDRMSCPALRDKVLEVFNVVEVKQLEQKLLQPPESLTVEERTLILDYADLMDSFIKAVKSTAQTDLENGLDVPGQKLVRGRKGNRKWIIEEEDVAKKLTKDFGLKKDVIFSDPKLLGIEKILKAVKAAPKYSDKKLEELESLIEQPEGKAVMAPVSDPREAIGSTRIRDAFKDVPNPIKK